MDQHAIFVDAGYLFAQGSTALTGTKRSRAELVLNPAEALEQLKIFACKKAPHCRLLRIYWYDGAIGGLRPTSDQALLAHLDDVKLRLGFINNYGQQKGVDSLIVTDLIEMARLKSISDAVLLSGDEDVRVGVQIAQNYGVRVHLLGIEPSRASQSSQLLQEADTTDAWDKDAISKFLSLREKYDNTKSALATADIATTENTAATDKIKNAVFTFVEKLAVTDIQGIEAYWETARGIPPDLDKRLLPACGATLGRNLNREEIRHMRACFQQTVKQRIS